MPRPSRPGLGLDLAQLERLVGSIPVDRFAEQRWFRAKRRRIAELRLDDAAPLEPDPDAAGRDVVMAVVRVSYRDAEPDDRYLLPLVLEQPAPRGPAARRGERAGAGISVSDPQTGALLREPRDGEGAWRRLAAAIAADLSLAALHGELRCRRTEALESLVPSAVEAVQVLDERRLRVEQTNTSVVLGERLIYKSYRLLEPGESPDLEVSAFLTSIGFPHTPAVAGSVRYAPEHGEPCVAGMLQALVAARGDAWNWLLGELRGGGDGLPGVRRIGRITAELHAALASRPEHPEFPSRVATVAETGAWRAGAERQLALAESALHDDEHRRLVALAPAVRARFADAFGSASASAPVSRIHGDYHLGQLLRVGEGFMVIDFEGEPVRALDERRGPHSPLKDVAGMLRSLDYAARTAEADPGRTATSQAGPTGHRFSAGDWLSAARGELLDAYRLAEVGVPLDPGLLAAFELEKACYEVRYEANNRPQWVWLPLAALERLAAA